MRYKPKQVQGVGMSLRGGGLVRGERRGALNLPGLLLRGGRSADAEAARRTRRRRRRSVSVERAAGSGAAMLTRARGADSVLQRGRIEAVGDGRGAAAGRARWWELA